MKQVEWTRPSRHQESDPLSTDNHRVAGLILPLEPGLRVVWQRVATAPPRAQDRRVIGEYMDGRVVPVDEAAVEEVLPFGKGHRDARLHVETLVVVPGVLQVPAGENADRRPAVPHGFRVDPHADPDVRGGRRGHRDSRSHRRRRRGSASGRGTP